MLVVQEIAAHAAAPVEGWWRDTVWASVLGHLDGRRFRAMAELALTSDDAIRNANTWMSRISAGGGIVFGLAGLGTLGLAATGVGAFSLGLADPRGVENFYLGELGDKVSDTKAGHDLALFAALGANAFDFPASAAAVLVMSASGVPAVEITTAAGQTKTIEVGTNGWRVEVEDSLDQAGATIPLHGESVGGAVSFSEVVGPAAFNEPREIAFFAASGLSRAYTPRPSPIVSPPGGRHDDEDDE